MTRSARLPRVGLVAALGALLALAVAGCSGGPAGAAGGTAVSPVTTVQPAASRSVQKVLVVVLENHDAATALRSMPTLAAAARRYATLVDYVAVSHPSLPNYLAIAGGSTSGVRDDGPPAQHVLPGHTVFGQAIAAGLTARTYADAMTRRCQTTSSGAYAVKHNPWAYYPTERSLCLRNDVPAGTVARGALAHDVAAGTLPNVGMLVPDRCHDAHDCSLGTADAYLRPWLRLITSGRDFTSGRLAVVITFDEDNRRHGNHVATVVLHRSLRGVALGGRYDHEDLSASLSALSGHRPLRGARAGHDPLVALGLRPR